MSARRYLAPLAVAAAVATGGVAGAVLGVPALSGAQESETSTEAPADGPLGRGGRFAHRGPGPALETAAEALGLSVEDLAAALREGKTIAQVAEEQGVDVNTVIDAIVAEIVERTGRDEATVREHVTQLVNEGRPEGGGRHHRHRGGPALEAAAEALGMERAELVAALREGKTIAQVAEEQGVDVNTVIDAMVAEARERIEQFVHEGPQHRPGAPGDDASGSSGDAEQTALAS
jgi:DNA-binding CsgD family transcriptional regulator